ncbi:MAG TPA: ATP-binding protein, partial [Polyangiaceae bacterium]
MPDDVLPSRFAWSFGHEARPGPTSDLWIGCDTGLARVHLGGWSSIDHAMGLRQESVYALLVTEDLGAGEALWVGARDGGLTRYQGGRWHTFGLAEGFDAKTVFALGEHVEPDGSRSLYVGTQDAGLLRWDGSRMQTVDPTGTVRRISETMGPDGRPETWVTNADNGLLHHVGDHWEHVGRKEGAPFDLAFAAVETPGSVGDRALFVATQGWGIARRQGGKWTTFDRASGAVLADSVTSIAVVPRPDDHRELWAGTEGGGASRLDLDAPGARWRVLGPTTATPIPNGTVYEITSDANRRVYLSTNKGVARISWLRAGSDEDADLRVETFDTEDGLPADENNGGALATDARGRVWVGTIAGVAVLDPAREVEAPEAKLRLAGRSLAGTGRSIAVGETLTYDDSAVAFDATLVSLFRGGETTYRTQIVGLDPAPGPWRPDGHRELSSLGSGSYVVRAWSRDFRGRVQGPLEMAFRVRPAPWLTWWAFVLYAAAAALAVRATVRWRLRAVERRNVELEARIRERTYELARANRAKTTFLSTMSHELRTPLNAILGFSQLLSRDRSLGGEAKESVEVVVKSGEHLLGLINDVLSITKIEAGKLVLDEAAFSLAGTVDAVEKMIRVRARSKRLTLQVEVKPGMPPSVFGDEGKVRQILLNLLGNAVKFTSEGGVAMRAWWDGGVAHFEVQDTGTGIAREELGALFEPFAQTEVGRKAKEGTGLGLFISRSYARLMNGDITVHSEVGRGTTFSVTLALPTAEASPSRADPRRVVGLAPGQGPYRVLIVDDAPDNRAVLARLLDKVGGFDVRQAATGTEAIAVFGEHRPHLTWMDLRMDGVDGIGATQAIRDLEIARGWSRSAIVALSASAFDRDREWLLASGCDDFVAKPYRENAIFDAIAKHLGVRFVHEGETAPAPTAAVTPDRLATLPERLRSTLGAAARAGDLRAARAVVGEITRVDDELGRSLREMVEGFRLEEIESLLPEHG